SRTLTGGTSTVHYATVPGGTATPGVDYTPTSGDLQFNPGDVVKTFTVPILDDTLVEATETINLALSNPTGGVVDFQATAVIQIKDNDQGTSRTFVVTNTLDSGLGSLRQAILDANAHPGADDIEFDIPASTDPNLNVPVPGFDPFTQSWTISLQSALP